MRGPSLLSTLSLILIAGWGGLLMSCRGTEVGNGKTGTNTKTEAAADGGQPGSAPTAQSIPNTMKDAGGEESAHLPSGPLESWLFVACASPLADNISGSFSDPSHQHSLSIVSTGVDKKSVQWNAVTYSIELQKGSGPYAISSEPAGPQVGCSPVQTREQPNGLVVRSLKLTNGVQVVWELIAGNVVRITIEPSPHAASLILNKD